MDIEKIKAELNEAYRTRQSRAAFGVIIRENIDELVLMTSGERAEWLREIGMPASYATEIGKEVGIAKYIKRGRK